MKKFLILFLLFGFICPVFSEEEAETIDNASVEEENIDDAEKESDSIKYNYVRNRAQISPKKEHKKILTKAQKAFEKDKSNLQKLKDKELWLLHDEANLLEYHP